MSVAQPPSENLPEFNNAVFKEANSTELSLAKANALYLARTGNATSSASNTTFSGTINGVIITAGSSNSVGIGTANNAMIRSVNVGAGNAIGNDAVCLGYLVTCGGASSVCVGRGTSTAYITGATAVGAFASAQYASSTALGYNAVANSANQITLGTTTEYVTCKGTNATNGSIQLDGNLRLQTTYTATPFASTMLGYSVSGSTAGTTFVTGIATGTANITTISLPSAGVWAIDYSVELTVNTSAMTVSIQSLYCSLTSNGTFAQRISNSGIIRTHSSFAYAIDDNPVFSGSFVYYVNGATTVYPVFSITTTSGTGTVTGTGFYKYTRVG